MANALIQPTVNKSCYVYKWDLTKKLAEIPFCCNIPLIPDEKYAWLFLL